MALQERSTETYSNGMKWLTVTVLTSVAVLGMRAEQAKFSAAVSPQDFNAAGLTALTPAQLERLDMLVESYKNGALVTARRAAEEAVAAKKAAEAQVAAAEASVQTARAEAAKAEAARLEAVKAESARAEAAKAARSAGILAKAKAIFQPSPKADEVLIESTIPGKFRGWDTRQVFVLANGQRWQVANDDHYYTPATENPRVQIRPAALSGYWMRFPDLGAEVRVRPLAEK
jgi:hypothetical protein